MTKVITDEYFKKQKELADKTEQHYAKWLKGGGWQEILITEGRFPDYDIYGLRDYKHGYWEIKIASASEEFGTYFVEYYQSGKPSGIITTKADWYVYYDERGEVRYKRVDEINDYVREKKLELKSTSWETVNGVVSGKGYLIPYHQFGFVMYHDIEI